MSEAGVDAALCVGNCKGFRVGCGPIARRWPLRYKMPNVRPPPISILKKHKPIIAGMPSLVLLEGAELEDIFELSSFAAMMRKVPMVRFYIVELFSGSFGHAGVPAGKYEKEAWRIVDPH